MAKDDQVETGELETGLPIEGMSQLFSEGEEEEKKGAEQVATAGTEGEEILSMEDLASKLGNIKVKVSIAGEERIISLPDAIKYQQKHAGLERTSERKTQELSRLLNELRGETERIKGQINSTATKPVEQENLEDPEVFVKHHARSVLQELNPKLEALEQAVSGLTSLVEPVVSEAQKKKAVSLIRVNEEAAFGEARTSTADFDTYHDKMVSLLERRSGKELTEEEVSKVPAGIWAQAYLVVSREPKPAALETSPTNRGEDKKKVLSSAGGYTPGGGGGSSGGQTISKLMREAKETGDYTKVLAMRGVKPASPGG